MIKTKQICFYYVTLALFCAVPAFCASDDLIIEFGYANARFIPTLLNDTIDRDAVTAASLGFKTTSIPHMIGAGGFDVRAGYRSDLIEYGVSYLSMGNKASFSGTLESLFMNQKYEISFQAPSIWVGIIPFSSRHLDFTLRAHLGAGLFGYSDTTEISSVGMARLKGKNTSATARLSLNASLNITPRLKIVGEATYLHAKSSQLEVSNVYNTLTDSTVSLGTPITWYGLPATMNFSGMHYFAGVRIDFDVGPKPQEAIPIRTELEIPTSPTTTAPVSGEKSVETRLIELRDLHEAKVITDDEYAEQKRQILQSF